MVQWAYSWFISDFEATGWYAVFRLFSHPGCYGAPWERLRRISDVSPCVHNCSHCSTAMSTRPAWHSGFFAWFMLLWPRHDHFSSRINFKRVQFWKSNQFVVTGLHLWIIYRGHCSHVWQQSKGFITKIVTRTEILAPVSLLLGTNFKWYRPILGDMLNWWIIRGDLFWLIMLQSKVL